MTSGAAGAAGGAAGAAYVIAQAIKASGAIVRVENEDFMTLVTRTEAPLVVTAEGGFFSTTYQYLTSYKGMVFYTKAKMPLEFTNKVEVVSAKKIWIPA